MVGAVGFEPTVHGIKTRCLTTWLRPNCFAGATIVGTPQMFNGFSKILAYNVRPLRRSNKWKPGNCDFTGKIIDLADELLRSTLAYQSRTDPGEKGTTHSQNSLLEQCGIPYHHCIYSPALLVECHS